MTLTATGLPIIPVFDTNHPRRSPIANLPDDL
jgi:hypothetical protein